MRSTFFGMTALNRGATAAVLAMVTGIAAPLPVPGPDSALNTSLSALTVCAAPSRAPQAINNEEDLNQWLTFYYANPQPDLLVPATLYAESRGFLNEESSGPYVSFLSQVFAQNPGKIATWVRDLDRLNNKTMLWTALWWSRTKEGRSLLDDIARSLPPKSQTALVEQVAKPAEPVEEMEISSPAVLDMLWGAFFATGDEKYVKRLATVLPWEKEHNDLPKMQIGNAANWSLSSNAEQHPKVFKILTQVREKEKDLRPFLDPIIEQTRKNLATANSARNR